MGLILEQKWKQSVQQIEKGKVKLVITHTSMCAHTHMHKPPCTHTQIHTQAHIHKHTQTYKYTKNRTLKKNKCKLTWESYEFDKSKEFESDYLHYRQIAEKVYFSI